MQSLAGACECKDCEEEHHATRVRVHEGEVVKNEEHKKMAEFLEVAMYLLLSVLDIRSGDTLRRVQERVAWRVRQRCKGEPCGRSGTC